jgi:uncharacterized membrane protein YfcA
VDQKTPVLKKNRYNKAIKYSGVAAQMALTIALCNYAGSWAAARYQADWIEPALTLFGIFASMALVIIQVIRDSKSNP